MTDYTQEELEKKVRELQKEVDRLNVQLKQRRFGLTWIDVPEAFDKESENKIPVLEEVPELAIRNRDGKPTHILIEGDNYHALTCLNYTHRGKVDVIYIDPPYNTGKDDFVYRDKRYLEEYPDGTSIKANHPLRHSAWLSFMSRRLRLAKELLSDNGVIFISIDDNEQANLKLLCDEVLVRDNFVGQLILKTATDNNPSQINIEHEYMLCYVKNKYTQGNWQRTSAAALKIKGKYLELKQAGLTNEEIQRQLRAWIRVNRENLPQVSHYNNVDNKGVYSSSSNSSNPHPGGYMYDIIHPITGRACPKPHNGWRWPLNTFLAYDSNGEIEWGPDETTQPHVKKRIETSTEYLRSLIYEDNRATTMALSDMFSGKKVFDNPKPTTVLSRIFDFASNESSIILDFFAGSGTTMHATMQLNEEDGGKRQCILCQLNEADICRNVTYERNKRVMCGYTNARGEAVDGLGNSLKYYRTAFVGKNQAKAATDDDKLTLAHKAGCLLALAENTLYEKETTDFYQFYSDEKDRWTCIYFQEDYSHFEEFRQKVVALPGKEKNVYVFCWTDGAEFAAEFEQQNEVTVKGIPQPILDIYKSLNA